MFYPADDGFLVERETTVSHYEVFASSDAKRAAPVASSAADAADP